MANIIVIQMTSDVIQLRTSQSQKMVYQYVRKTINECVYDSF